MIHVYPNAYSLTTLSYMYYCYNLSNALVNSMGHSSAESVDFGNNEYLLSDEHGNLSSISTFTY